MALKNKKNEMLQRRQVLVSEFADMLYVAPHTVKNWLRKKKLTGTKRLGRWYVDVSNFTEMSWDEFCELRKSRVLLPLNVWAISHSVSRRTAIRWLRRGIINGLCLKYDSGYPKWFVYDENHR